MSSEKSGSDPRTDREHGGRDETRASDEPKHRVTRRSLLDRVIMVGGGAWLVGISAPAAVYLWPATASGPSQDQIKVGSLSGWPVGEAKMTHNRGEPIVVIRETEEKIKAFSAICTHLGCVVKWDRGPGVLACPCHAGFFDANGQVISGPPPRPLKEYSVLVVDEQVIVKVG